MLAIVTVAAFPVTLIGQVPVGVPPRVSEPELVTIPVRVSPPYPPVPLTLVTLPVEDGIA